MQLGGEENVGVFRWGGVDVRAPLSYLQVQGGNTLLSG